MNPKRQAFIDVAKSLGMTSPINRADVQTIMDAGETLIVSSKRVMVRSVGRPGLLLTRLDALTVAYSMSPNSMVGPLLLLLLLLPLLRPLLLRHLLLRRPFRRLLLATTA